MDITRRSLAFGLTAATCWAASAARGAEWPERPVTFVVPFPAGGSTDVVARLFAERYGETLKQNFVVENRPGANGNIAAAAVAKAPADGYTILVSGNGQNAMNHSLYARMPYDSTKDFAHICLLASTPNVIIVPSASDIGSFDALIRQARTASEGLAFASPGTGSSGHLSLAMLENAANIKVRHVPYRGAAPLVTDVLGGHVPVGIVNVDIPLAHVQSGKLRVLAVTSANRSALYPDAKTVAESGFPGFEAQGWFGLSAPARTPPAIVSKLNQLANQFLQDGKMKQRFAAGGYLSGGGTPQDYSDFIEGEIVKWAGVVRASGISIE
ncbi:Tripartite-type tricarboxylate transporter, receptor component TctC [Bosea sp. OK403]|uniref:Bug family tripartite tricarboxylate transporter substrate binding protein n=1 Tax=Bosea sp. OK403 TaxID=1855286 RepID=UPI0008E93506|nr:tripartite tricarboxylate transporter substrate binding protein [Bosea sp. OK403]SFJ77631.1 Tripartite-type tricarboxylate transporter, receptor component TctC [Bosea sp. OK403]